MQQPTKFEFISAKRAYHHFDNQVFDQTDTLVLLGMVFIGIIKKEQRAGGPLTNV